MHLRVRCEETNYFCQLYPRGPAAVLINKKKGRDLRLDLFAPACIELLNLWNDFRKVVQFIDDNQTWLRPLMDRVAANKKAEEK